MPSPPAPDETPPPAEVAPADTARPDAARPDRRGRMLAGGALAVGLVALVGVAAALVDAVEVLVRLVVQVGVPLGLVGYVGWRRLQVARQRRAAIATGGGEGTLAREGMRQARTSLARSIATFGGGFYGLAAAGTFLVYQVRTFAGAAWRSASAWHATARRATEAPLAFLTDDVGGALWSMVFGIGQGWIDGFVYAMTWPVHLMERVGPFGLVVAMAVGAVAFRLARRRLPGVEAFAQEVEQADPADAWRPFPKELVPEQTKTPAQTENGEEP